MDKKCQLEIIWINMWVGSGEPTFTVLRVHSLNCITIVVLTNSYGHPHKSTLKLLDEFGVETYRTDENGTVVISTEGSGVTIKTGQTSMKRDE